MNNTEQLRLISIFHYVIAGLDALFACFGLIYLFMGLSLALSPGSWSSPGNTPPPPFMGWIFVAIGGAWVLAGLLVAGLTALSGWYISKKTHKSFSIVIAAINCLFVPLGTILGVFTIVILSRDAESKLYGSSDKGNIEPVL